MTIKNKGSVVVFLGGADVAATTGLELAVDAVLQLVLDANATLYGIVSSSTAAVHVLMN